MRTFYDKVELKEEQMEQMKKKKINQDSIMTFDEIYEIVVAEDDRIVD